MCLVSVCKKGTPKYTDEVVKFIKKGASSNRSGSGFMFKRDGEDTITINKGYFDVEELLKDLKAHNLQDSDELVIHHRIPTAGNADAFNTHPFVISTKHEEVIMVKGTTKKPCLAHNGVFSMITGYMDLDSDFSDTYAFSRYIMANKSVMNFYLHDRNLFDTLTKHIIGSYNKVALMFPDRDLELIGDFNECNGYFHSNWGFKTYTNDVGGSSSRHNNRQNPAWWDKTLHGAETDNFENEEDYEFMAAYPTLGQNSRVGNICPVNQNPNQLTIVHKKKNPLWFDFKTILITDKNCRDFEYFNKAKFLIASPENRPFLTKYMLEEVNDEALNQVMRIDDPDAKHICRQGMPLEDIRIEYVYVPKPTMLSYYEAFNTLMEKNLKVTKSNIKNLRRTLANSHKRGPGDLILFKQESNAMKGIKVLYPKKALQMYLDFVDPTSELHKQKLLILS